MSENNKDLWEIYETRQKFAEEFVNLFGPPKPSQKNLEITIIENTYLNLPKEKRPKSLARKYNKFLKKRNAFAKENQGLVHKLCSNLYDKYKAITGKKGNYKDISQQGNIGLLHAITLFDPTKNIKFSTYASNWINAYAQKELYRHFLIHIPWTHKLNAYRKKIKPKFLRKSNLARKVFSYNTSVSLNKSDKNFIGFLEAEDSSKKILENKELKELCDYLINNYYQRLKKIEKKVIRKYYLEGKTLEEIANSTKPLQIKKHRNKEKPYLSRQRIEQIKENALEKLRNAYNEYLIRQMP